MQPATVQGRCLCGSVRFSASLPTKWVAHCHCTYCRRAHGAAFVTWAGFVDTQVVIDPTGTQPQWYESSPGAQRGFCPRCGTPMLFFSQRWPGEMHVARATIDAALDRDPAAHVFFDTHVPWLDVNDRLPKKYPAGTEPAPGTHPETPDDDFFRALEAERTQALVARDVDTIRRLHSPDYELISVPGRSMSLERYLAMMAIDVFYAGWEHGPIRVERGADMAAVRYAAKITFPSSKVVHCWHTDLYERHAGAWRAVWSQATEMPPP